MAAAGRGGRGVADGRGMRFVAARPAPALLGSAKEITSAPAGVQEYTGATQVTMIPTVSQTRELGSATPPAQ